MSKYLFFILAILILSFSGCKEDVNFGEYEAIKMDKKSAEMTAEGGVETFECQNYNLFLNSVEVIEGGESVRKWETVKFKEEYPGHEDDWFSFDFPPKEGDRNYTKKFRVEVEPNNTATERSVKFGLYTHVHEITVVVVQKGK